MTTTTPADPLVVLVLDDREESRYITTTWLTRSGFTVVEASTGAEAIGLVRAQRVDIAVLDVNLPDMTGYEVCEFIRANRPTATMPVIHLSATAVGSADRSQGLLRGADAYLAEPLEPRDLLATITALIRRAGMRERTTLTTKRLRILNSVTADVHASSDDDQVFDAVLAGAIRFAGSHALIVRRLGESGVVIRSNEDGSGGPNAAVTTPVDLVIVDRLLDAAMAGATMLTTDDPALVGEPFVGTPFVDESGEPAGAILIPASADGAEDEIVPMLAQLAIAIALARANMRALDIEHRIALVLQQSLLPQTPPQVVGVDIAFRYLASSEHTEVGGDFYEAVALDDGTLAVAIGDVVGHSLRAATVMGELRHALRAYAIEGYGPDEILERLDRLIHRFHPTMFTSVIYGVVDIAAGEFRFCNAGHLPPLIVGADGSSRWAEGHGSIVGIGAATAPVTTVPLHNGDRLVLVTDGLLERRYESLDVGLERLRRAATSTIGTPLDAAIDRIIAEVGPTGAPDDDIAILAVDRR